MSNRGRKWIGFSAGVIVAGAGVLGAGARKPEMKAVGIFEEHGDVGEVAAAYKGDVVFDAAKGTYTIMGGGENIWFAKDAFHYAWKQMSGDVTLTADVVFLGEGKNPHRKAVLMVRQSLDADAAYADIAVHGVGMTAIQFRDQKGGLTREVQANLDGDSSGAKAPGQGGENVGAKAPTPGAPIVGTRRRVRLVKQGDYFTMWVAREDGKFVLGGASPKVVLKAPFYVGIGVCSHEKDLVEKAVFSNVEVKEGKEVEGVKERKLYSLMEIINVESKDRRAVYVAEGRFEAPNWMPDGKSLIFNRGGRIEKIAITGGATETIDTGFALQCNNDHGVSPDGKELVVSDNSQKEHESRVYLLPIGGGTPRLITKNAPSYWHGWSPDGKTLAFVGQRNGEFDIYTISVNENSSSGAEAQSSRAENVGALRDSGQAKASASGGTAREGVEETRLTTAKGLDDGPEYTPDGKYIYFNSERTGHMQIWRMKADGSEQEQVTFGEQNDWFPHFSPDGEKMVFLSYDAGVKGHPENKDVMLRMMTMKDGKIVELAKLFGGQGTINVPSWSPDGKEIAFVSYVEMK